MAFTKLRPLTDREVRTLLPENTGPEPTLEPIPEKELSSLLPEPTFADRAAGIVNAIPTPFPDLSMPTLPKSGGEFLDKIPFPKMIEKAGREVKDTVQSSLGNIVSEPPPTKIPFTDIPIPEKARDLFQLGKAGVGGTLATAAELAPFTPSEFANWAAFELAPGELAQAFPKTAEFLNTDIAGPIASRLRYTINQIKYKLGIPQETGMVSWAKGAMARGEITPAEAARMDQSIYDSMLEERNKLPATESGSEPRTPASEQPAAPLPSAITPADLPSADLANAVAMAPKPYVLPSFGPQMDPESVAMTASKMSQAMGVTAQNVLDAMNAAAQAIGTTGDQAIPMGENASNAAFFARLPLRQVLSKLGVPPEAMEGFLEALKAGDPMAARQFMDQMVNADLALAEVLPRVEEIMGPKIQDMIQQAAPELPDRLRPEAKAKGFNPYSDIIRRGGLHPDLASELKAIDVPKNLFNKNSKLGLDGLRESWAEQGVIPKDSTMDDVMGVIENYQRQLKSGEANPSLMDQEALEKHIKQQTSKPVNMPDDHLLDETVGWTQRLANGDKLNGTEKLRLLELTDEVHSRFHQLQPNAPTEAVPDWVNETIEMPESPLLKETRRLGIPDALVMEEVYKDPLTGALNRRYIEGMGLDQVGHIQLDIDDFKANVNSKYGHAVGDDVLKILVKTAQLMGHRIGRLGGEEFGLYPTESEDPIKQGKRFLELQDALDRVVITDFEGNHLFTGIRVSGGFGYRTGRKGETAGANYWMNQAKGDGKDRLLLDKKEYLEYISKEGLPNEWNGPAQTYTFQRGSRAPIPREPGDQRREGLPRRENDLQLGRGSVPPQQNTQAAPEPKTETVNLGGQNQDQFLLPGTPDRALPSKPLEPGKPQATNPLGDFTIEPPEGDLFKLEPLSDQEVEKLVPPDAHSGEHGVVANPLAIADDVKAYLEKSRETIPISEDIQHSFNLLQTRGQADELRAKQLLEQIELTPAEAENITHHLDDPSYPLTEHENKIYESAIKPILKESSAIYSELKNEGVPMDNELHLRRYPVNKGGVFDRLLQKVNSVGGKSGILRQTTGGMKHRVMKALVGENGERQVISVRGGDITGWKGNQPQFLGKLNLKKYQDLMDKDITPLKRRLEKLQSEAKILRSIKTREAVSSDTLNRLKSDATALAEKIKRSLADSTKDEKIKDVYKTFSKEIERIQVQTKELEQEKESTKGKLFPGQGEGAQQIYLKKIAALNKELNALYNKEINLGYSDLYDQAISFLKDIEVKEMSQDRDLKKLNTSLAEIKILSKIPASEDLILRKKRLETLDVKIMETLAHISVIEQSYSPYELNQKAFVDRNGKRWRIAEAAIKEIEQNTSITYHKNALLNSLQNYNELRKVQLATEYLEALKASPGFSKFAMKYGAANIPEKWKGTDLAQFRGYAFEPRIADFLNHFNEQMMKGGDPLAVLNGINSFFRTTIFFSPLMHVPNIGAHWITARGVSPWIMPARYWKLFKTGSRAIKAVSTQNQDYLHMLDSGVNLQYYNAAGEKLRDLMLQKMGEEMSANKGLVQDLTQIFGFANPAAWLQTWYKWSGKVTWFTNDVAILQAIYEEMDNGKTQDEAIDAVSKHIPDYRIPARVLGSRALSYIMSNPLVTMFSAYHYGALKSYGEMLKSVIKPELGGERKEAFDKLAMLGVLIFVLYPLMDELVQHVSGDKRYHMRRAGSATFPTKTYEFLKGKIPFSSYAQSVFTPSVIARLGMDAWTSGQKLSQKTPGKVATALSGAVAPLGILHKFKMGKISFKEFFLNVMGAQKAKTKKLSGNLEKALK